MLDKKNNLELFGDFKERTINAKLRFSAILFFLFFGYFLITLKIISLSASYNKELSKNASKHYSNINGLKNKKLYMDTVKNDSRLIKKSAKS